jgi:hypothetical protein
MPCCFNPFVRDATNARLRVTVIGGQRYPRSSSSGCTHAYGVISRCCVKLIICTDGEYRGVRHDRHLSAGSSFQIGVSRGLRIASSGSAAL